MSAASPSAPTWDLTDYFPGLDTADFRTFRDALNEDARALLEEAGKLPPLTTATVESFAALLLRTEALSTRVSHMGSYLGCLTAANARNEAAQTERANMATLGATLEKASVSMRAALRDASPDALEALASHPDLTGLRYPIARLHWEASHQMASELEMLNADLEVDGIGGWSRLYDQVAGTLSFTLKRPDGSTETVPMARRRSLLENPDRNIRKAAFEGGNAAWAGMEHVTAACLNHIAGARLTLYARRGHEDFLEPALFDSGITRRTLTALMEAIQQTAPITRRLLALKARVMNLPKLAFYDLAAPLPLQDHRTYSWPEAEAIILDAFSSYPRLQDYARRAFANRWVEGEIRDGKRPGAFCTSSLKIRQSRVFMTYNGTLGDIRTLGHELGHAFHNEVMRDLRPMARSYPMTLAETASTFAEGMVLERLRTDPSASPETVAKILDTELTDAAIYLLDIPMRYYFEESLYRERASGELPVSKLKSLICEAQVRSFAEVLDPEQLDPYFWASKLHFYIAGISFYNYPYTYGFLFSRALFDRWKKDGAAFFARYEAALIMTGTAPAEAVVREALGEDTESPDFWARTIRTFEPEIAHAEAAYRRIGLLK